MKLVTAIVLSLVALTACSGKSAQGPLSVALSFAPSPPVKGFDTLTVRVTDSGGNPVSGARVQITSKMPMMSMSGPTLIAADKGAGNYVVRGNLQYATAWVFDITAAAEGATGAAHVTQTVK